MSTSNGVARTVLWIRHGATDWNVSGRYLGGTDLPLNDVGRAEVRRLAEACRNLRVRRLLTSPLQRAHATALALQQVWQCELVVDDRLKELHFGAWEGLTVPEIQQRFPKLWAQWLTCSVQGPFPGGGESFAAMHRRVGAFVKAYATDVTEPIAVVAHGGVLRSALVHVLRLPIPYYWSLQIGRASVSCTQHEGNPVVLEYLNRCVSDEATDGVNAHA